MLNVADVVRLSRVSTRNAWSGKRGVHPLRPGREGQTAAVRLCRDRPKRLISAILALSRAYLEGGFVEHSVELSLVVPEALGRAEDDAGVPSPPNML